MTKLPLLSLAALSVLGGIAHGNAFLLNEFDAKAVGRGNAVVATDIDPSAIYYNIGGLAVANGTQAMVGGALIAPSASFTDTAGVKTDSSTPTQFVPGVFVSSRVSSLVAVGLGFSTPFGLANQWPSTSPQANIVENLTLHTFFITPSVGLNLGSYVPGLTVGGGLDLVPATVELRQAEYFGEDRGSAHLAGTAFGVGGRIGVMYRPAWAQRLSLGVMWRSDVKESFTGNGNFDAPAPYRSLLPPDGAISTSLTLPQQVSGGIGYRPVDPLELEADVIWTNWSKFKSLDITVPAMGTGTMTIPQPEDYTNTFTARVGVAYQLTRFALRVGYIYDPTPIPAERLTVQLPDINRNDVTAGASVALGQYAVHAGLLYVIPGSRKTADTPYQPFNKGTFDVAAFVASVTLSGQLGAK